MKLNKRRSRVHKGVEYFQYFVNLPMDKLEIAKWEEGQKLKCKVRAGSIILEKEEEEDE